MKLYLYLGTAGIGRQRFRVWPAEGRIDRGDDSFTSGTPRLALEDAARRRRGEVWRGTIRWTNARRRRRQGLQEILVERTDDRWRATMAGVEDSVGGDLWGGGHTLDQALACLGLELEATLSLHGWHSLKCGR